MDPNAPQQNTPAVPPETPDEDASVVAPPPEPAPPLPQTNTLQAPPAEPPDEDEAFLPGDAPIAPPTVPDVAAPVSDASQPVAAWSSGEPAILPTEEASTAPTSVSVNEQGISPAPVSTDTEPAVLHPTAPPRSHTDMATLSRIGLVKRRKLKDKKLEHLLALAAEKKRIAVSDAQLLLHISKKTAEVYLGQLVSLGHLDRRGRAGSTEYWWRG